MPPSLQKKAAKQKARIAALNTLGTPASSRTASEVEDDLDSVASEASYATADGVAPFDEFALSDELRRCVDDLGEKRASTREAALTGINRLLAHYYCGELFSRNQTNQEALLQLLIRSIRKPGSPQEAVQAARGIALAFLNQGDTSAGEQEDLFGMVLSLLKNIIAHSLDPQLKYQAIETLAMITFIAASNADTRGGLEYFADILTSEGTTLQPEELEESEMLSANELDDLVYACLRAYGLLYASVYGDGRGTWEDAWDESQAKVSHILDCVMEMHLDMLRSRSKSIRVAAGENVALMMDCVQYSRKKAEEEKEEELAELPEYGETEELREALERLATDSNRRVNKQDRKEQRSAFRDILQSIDYNRRPKRKLKIGGQQLMFRGWAQIMELRAFRNLLGPGIGRHFQENEILHAVFASGFDESSASERASSEEEGHGFGLEEGDEIEYMASSRTAASRRDRAMRLKRNKSR